MSPRQIFQTNKAAVAQLSSLLESDLFLQECLNVALNEYTSKLFANNANDALLLAGQLKGAKGVLDELRNLHKTTTPIEKPASNILDYGANKHVAVTRPSSTKHGPGHAGPASRPGLNPP